MKPIRLGIVRCDVHGFWYGPFLSPCNPTLLEKHAHEVHHYFSAIHRAEELRFQPVPGFQITHVWDEAPQLAQAFAETFGENVEVCNSPEQMAAAPIDAVFIADCLGDGADHVRLASPFLKRGIPTYVDKPFAPCLRDAQTMIDLARQHNTPVMSASLLEYVPHGTRFRARFSEIDSAGLVVIKGVGGAGLAGIIHGISLARNLLGDGVEWVQAMGHTALDPAVATKALNRSDFTQWNDGAGIVPMTWLNLHYRNGQEAMVMNTSHDLFPAECSFYASAYSRGGAIHSPPIGDPEFLGGGEVVVKLFRQMVQTRKPVISYDSLLEKIAILDAARLAQQQGRPVRIDEVLKSAAKVKAMRRAASNTMAAS